MPGFNEKSLRSLALRTDLMFHRFGGQVQQRRDYLVVRTPTNPGYFYGNMLVFPRAPRRGEPARWLRCFAQEFGASPEVKHVCFGWDGKKGEIGAASELETLGFDLDLGVVLTATNVRPPVKAHPTASVRPLITDAEWERATEIQIDCRDPRHDLATYTPYKVRQMQGYRSMAAKGLGSWFGAFVDGKQYANLGLFFEGAIGRFQMVATAPAARRQGLCSRLVYETSRTALAADRAQCLVMVADANYFAAGIYQSVGFRPTERTAGAFQVPKCLP